MSSGGSSTTVVAYRQSRIVSGAVESQNPENRAGLSDGPPELTSPLSVTIMSYTRKGLGAVDIGQTINTIVSGLGVATEIAQDPYLRETICRVGQVSAANKKQPIPPCTKMADGLPGGVGLRKVIKPLRAYSYAEQHPVGEAGGGRGCDRHPGPDRVLDREGEDLMYLSRRSMGQIDVAAVPWWTFGAVAAFAAWLGYLAGKQAS